MQVCITYLDQNDEACTKQFPKQLWDTLVAELTQHPATSGLFPTNEQVLLPTHTSDVYTVHQRHVLFQFLIDVSRTVATFTPPATYVLNWLVALAKRYASNLPVSFLRIYYVPDMTLMVSALKAHEPRFKYIDGVQTIRWVTEEYYSVVHQVDVCDDALLANTLLSMRHNHESVAGNTGKYEDRPYEPVLKHVGYVNYNQCKIGRQCLFYTYRMLTILVKFRYKGFLGHFLLTQEDTLKVLRFAASGADQPERFTPDLSYLKHVGHPKKWPSDQVKSVLVYTDGKTLMLTMLDDTFVPATYEVLQ